MWPMTSEPIKLLGSGGGAGKVVKLAMAVTLLLLADSSATRALATPFKVLVVLSYRAGYPWQDEIARGIKTECGNDCELKFVSLDMKINPQGGLVAARKAFELYEDWHPDGVIAADDYAQSAFVVPYLKEKVATPVIFCGVNEDPKVYGYPARNVSGVLERLHTKETIALLKQLVPAVKRIGFMMRGNEPSTVGMVKEIELSTRAIPGIRSEMRTPATLEEALKLAKELAARNDALYLEHFEGIPDAKGLRHSNSETIGMLLGVIGKKPTICATDSGVRQGVLASVVMSGAEQGILAVKLLRAALNGSPAGKIPITQNRNGVKYLNVKTLKDLGIAVKPALLRDIKMVTKD